VRPFHLRASVFTLLEEGKLTSVVGRLAQIMLISLIIANVVAVALETIPSICARWHVFFGDFEKFSVGGYTVEYIIRMWSSVEDSRIDGEDANSDLQPVRLVNVECMTLTLFFFCIRLSRFIHRLTVPTIRRRP